MGNDVVSVPVAAHLVDVGSHLIKHGGHANPFAKIPVQAVHRSGLVKERPEWQWPQSRGSGGFFRNARCFFGSHNARALHRIALYSPVKTAQHL